MNYFISLHSLFVIKTAMIIDRHYSKTIEDKLLPSVRTGDAEELIRLLDSFSRSGQRSYLLEDDGGLGEIRQPSLPHHAHEDVAGALGARHGLAPRQAFCPTGRFVQRGGAAEGRAPFTPCDERPTAGRGTLPRTGHRRRTRADGLSRAHRHAPLPLPPATLAPLHRTRPQRSAPSGKHPHEARHRTKLQPGEHHQSSLRTRRTQRHLLPPTATLSSRPTRTVLRSILEKNEE